jgi:hypothetical protein
VATLLKRELYEPCGVVDLLAAHEEATSIAHDLADLTTQRSVQQLLSTERHEALFQKLMAQSSTRSSNLMLASSMPHASDWLLAADRRPRSRPAVFPVSHCTQISSGHSSVQ